MDTNNIIKLFNSHLQPLDYKKVYRSNLISPYFVGEFNLSGAHDHLIPAIQSKEKVDIDSISVVDLVMRKVDAEIVGISNSHLLLFEMGVFGSFGYIDNVEDVEQKQLEILFSFFEKIGIRRNSVYITVSDGGDFNGEHFDTDYSTIEILKKLGIGESKIIRTKGRRNFMFSQGIDRLAGYNIEFFIKKNDEFLEIASSNIYEYLNKLNRLEKTINSGVGCGIGFERLSYAVSEFSTIYEVEPYRTIAEAVVQLIGSRLNFEIIRGKIFRLIELTKTIIFLANDGVRFNKTPQGRAFKRYIAKVNSELTYINFDKRLFFEIVLNGIAEYYSERYTIKEEAIALIISKLNSG